MPVIAGPEFNESGDPEWIEPEYREGGAFSGDQYSNYGRWRERLFPIGDHAADSNPLHLGRVGLHQAMVRLHDAFSVIGGYAAADVLNRLGGSDPTVLAIIATYDALEWVHSLDDHLKRTGRYKRATAIDQVHGPYVLGAVGARNASHHGLRRVVGVVDVPRAVYKAEGRRWVHTGTYNTQFTDIQVRWTEFLPLESGGDSPNPLRYPDQEQAFRDYLAGRDVRNTFNSILTFFSYSLEGSTPDVSLIFGPAVNPPPIDPVSFSDPPPKE